MNLKLLQKAFQLPLRSDFYFKIVKKPPPNIETVVATNLPVCLDDASPPGPDHKDRLSTLVGSFKRLAAKVHICNFSKMKKILRYSRKYIHPQFQTFSSDQIADTQTWINNINHPESRKQELRLVYEKVLEQGAWQRLGTDDEDLSEVNSFIKDEKYDDMKPSRWINSSSDLIKVIFGPIADRCMEELVKCSSMIKTVPVQERAKAIWQDLGGADVEARSSDATAMEDHYANIYDSTLPVSEQNDPRSRIALELMIHMCGGMLVPERMLRATKFLFFRTPKIRHQPKLLTSLWTEIRDAPTLGIFFKNIINTYRRLGMRDFGYALINAILCSGEMDTSFRNTASMYVMVNFATFDLSKGKHKLTISKNEGDDALSVHPAGCGPTTEWWAKYGWVVKVEFIGRVNEASFCGLVFAPEDLVSCPDIRQTLVKFGWSNRKYARSSNKVLMGLLRAKALSMACEYGNVPILGALSQRLLHLTRTINVRKSIIWHTDLYERERLQRALKQKPWLNKPNVGWQTRVLVANLQNIPISAQLEAEEAVSNISLFSFFSLPMIDFSSITIHNNSLIISDSQTPRSMNMVGRAQVCNLMIDMVVRDIDWPKRKKNQLLSTLAQLKRGRY
jgi:hypothetical protein